MTGRFLRLLAAALVLLPLAGVVQRNALAQPQGGASGPPPAQGQNRNGMHIYLWGGLKSHGEGQHDYPQFLADWSKLLTERGAVVDGALHSPRAADLEHADVVVIYKGDAAYLSESDKTALEAYVKRGGGLVSFHDSLCGPDPAYFAGAGWRSKEAWRGELHAGSSGSLRGGGSGEPHHEGHDGFHDFR